MNKIYLFLIATLCCISAKAEDHYYVEIGGVKWATMNVGATTVSGAISTCAGDFYPWAGTETYYNSITWSDLANKVTDIDWKEERKGGYITYTGSSTNVGPYQTGYYSYSKYNSTDKLTTLLSEDDVATVKWGSDWRMPTREEFLKLCNACGVSSTTYASITLTTVTAMSQITKGGVYWLESGRTYDDELKDVYGVLFVSTDDIKKRVFFPAAGYFSNGATHSSNASGILTGKYLLSDLYNTYSAYSLYISGGTNSYFSCSTTSTEGRYNGNTVRPVYTGPVGESVTCTLNPGKYQSFCLPFPVTMATLNNYFDHVYCMTGSWLGSNSMGGREEQTSDTIKAYSSCAAPLTLYQNTDGKETFHVFMKRIPLTIRTDATIPAGTPFYAHVKDDAASSFTLSAITISGAETEDVTPFKYCYTDGVRTETTLHEFAALTEGKTVPSGATQFNFTEDGTFKKSTSALTSNTACIYTTAPVDNIVIHWDSSTDTGRWSAVAAMVKSATVGDPNRDGKIDTTDVSNIVSNLIGNASTSIDSTAADVDGDNKVNIVDVTRIIDSANK